MTRSANRLANERSAYLRSAAHQPVDWMPWGREAFDRAVAEDKPILLDVGAVWCHWCHVMDRESYEDAATAEVVNRLFVAVKVDRDERPDVDVRYQKVVQALTGQGGWPLTAFLLPDGRCFYGGTYFPPVDAHGRPSFRRVLEAVAEAYRERRGEALHNADALQEHLAHAAAAAAPADEARFEELIARAVASMRQMADPVNGGFGRAPKFPHPAAHDLLLARPDGRDVALFTLERMRAGGVYDQLAGGFHRYSVDAEWVVPHFEKMLYDNAGLLRNYARAHALTGREEHAATAREIAGFLRDVLQQQGGGFGGSQDADVDTVRKHGADGPAGSSSVHDDGDHFTWTLDELRTAVGDERLARVMAARFGVEAVGDMHHDPRRNVLTLAADEDALAKAFGADAEAVAEGMRRMRDARAKRPAPFVDPTRYTNWNGMAAQALLEWGGVSGDRDADAMTLRALDALLQGAFEPDRGFARSVGSPVFGILDDNAQALDALVEAHAATGEARYLTAARRTADVLLDRFRHPRGGFADRAATLAPPGESRTLESPERPTQDAPSASANGVACRALLRLADASGEARYRDEAMAALRAMAEEAARASLFGGAILLAMQDAARPPPRIVVRGDAEAYRAVARRHARPGATFATPDDPGVPEEARAFPGEGAMVCVGTRCLAPARSPEELAERLRSA